MSAHSPIEPQQWIVDQKAYGRQIFLIIDRLAEPDPITQLFGLDLMQEYINLYAGTDYNELKDMGPWLIKIPEHSTQALSGLLDAPEPLWGWLASADQLDLAGLATHWRERMVIVEANKKALYRFQDNRVISHHLTHLSAEQRPLLLGPLHNLLCWHQDQWNTWVNPAPAPHPEPINRPWLDIPEPDDTAHAIRLHNLQQWLWQEHPTAATQLATREPLKNWLQRQLQTAQHWGWDHTEQLHFLLQHQLNSQVTSQPFWATLPGETPTAHFQRCRNELNNILIRSTP